MNQVAYQVLSQSAQTWRNGALFFIVGKKNINKMKKKVAKKKMFSVLRRETY